jgi:hypothetical protein
MAKIRVEQIKDLMLTPAPTGGENVTRSIQIGTSNSIIPLTGVSTTETEGSVAGVGYISGLSVSGNLIELTRTALPEIEITGNGENDGDFVLNAVVNETDNHQIDLTRGTFDVNTGAGESAHTGSLIFGTEKVLKVNPDWVNSVVGDGKLQVKFGTADATDLFTANAATGTTATLELETVAKTGKAADVNVAAKVNENGVTVVPAGTVQGTLESIAAEIDAMDLDATDVVALSEDKKALQAGKIKEEDGKVAVETAVNVVEFNQAISSANKVATMADVTAAQNNATVVGEKAIEVKTATGEGATGKVVSLKIKSDDKILDQTADDGLFSTLSLTYDTAADDDGKKYIRLKGKNNTDISTIDATDFIKDGMLADAEYVENPDGQAAGKYIVLTFNTDSGKTPVYVNVTALVDTYTAKANGWIELNDHEFSHKTQGAFTPVEGQQSAPQTTFGANAADVTADAAGESVEFKVPSFTVDAAGHVTAASEKTVTVALPAAQTITGEGGITQGDYINVKVTATEDANHNYTLTTTSKVTTQAVATAAAAVGETPAVDGLATALDVKTYVDSKVAGATEEDTQTIEFSKVVKGTRTGAGEVALTPGEGYKIEAASVCVYINGQLIPAGGYTIPADSNKVTIHANQYGEAGSDFELESTDRIDVVAHATKTVTLTYLKLQTTQNA